MPDIPTEALEDAAKAAYLHDWRNATEADWLALQKDAPEEAAGYRSMARTIAPILVAAGRAQAEADLREKLALLFAVYDMWMNKVDCYDPDDMPGIASLIGTEGSFVMEAATDAVKPHEAQIRQIIEVATAGAESEQM